MTTDRIDVLEKELAIVLSKLKQTSEELAIAMKRKSEAIKRKEQAVLTAEKMIKTTNEVENRKIVSEDLVIEGLNLLLDLMRPHFEKLGLGIVEAERAYWQAYEECSFGPGDWKNEFGVYIPKQQTSLPCTRQALSAILESPCPFVSGKRVKDTHYLYYDLGYSVVDWKDFDKKTLVLNDETDWYSDYHWSNDRSEAGWLLVFKGIIPGSLGKSLPEQEKLIPDAYYVPSTANYLAMLVLQAKKHGESSNLCVRHFGRTADEFYFNGQRSRALAGRDGKDIQVILFDDWGQGEDDTGLFLARKLDQGVIEAK